MKLCIHRGSRQIGGSCVEVESGGKRLLLDLGLPLDADGDTAGYLPNIPGLDGKNPSLLGILVSHPHLDHFGLLKHVSRDIKVGMGVAARRILTAAAPFMKEKYSPHDGWDYSSGQSFKVGPFTVTPYIMDHSAYDAYSLLIESEGKRILYSGDFRGHGRKGVLFKKFIKSPPEHIDVLFMEGTCMDKKEKGGYYTTESELEEKLVKVFNSTSGLALVHSSVQNIDRVVSVFRASKKTARKLVIDLYAAAVLRATENQKLPQSGWDEVLLYIPEWQRRKIKRNRWFDQLKVHSTNRIFPEELVNRLGQSTMLFRPVHIYDLEKYGLIEGSSYIYSMWEGYWNKKELDGVRNFIDRNNIPRKVIHTSGHAGIEDLKKVAGAINPGRLVPIHSFSPEKFSDVFDNVEIHNDGEWWV